MKRVVQIGLGPLGVRIANDLIERQVGQLVGVLDRAPHLNGRPVSEFCPNADPRLRIHNDAAAIDWGQVDCAIVATSSELLACEATFRDLLRRGLAVVSTCEELVYPWLRHVAVAEELHDLGVKHGGRLLGTGVNPGFLMDYLPIVLSGVSKSVRGVRCYRIQDASARRIPFQKKIGAGLDDDQFAARIKDKSLRHVGLGESLHFIAHYLGLRIERWEEDIGPVRADRDLVCGLGAIPRGRAAGVRQVARGYADERVVIHLEFQAAIGQHEPHDRVVIDGEPTIDTVIPGGVHGDIATSAVVINAIPRIINALPGLHTMATIPAPVHAMPGREPR